MHLSSHQSLSIVIIIYFVPALLVAGWICISRGVGQQLGWLYLFILALARIVGASLQIASAQNRTDGFSTAATIIASSGLIALILVMLELLQKVKESLLKSDPIPPTLWRVLHLSQWAAFILSIVGFTYANDRLSKAATIIVTVIFALQTFISIVFAIQIKHIFDGHKRIMIVLISSIPFLALRVLYGMLSTFVTTGGVFGGSRPSVIALALMQYLMEFIVVPMYLVAGLWVTTWRDKKSGEEDEIQMTRGSDVTR